MQHTRTCDLRAVLATLLCAVLALGSGLEGTSHAQGDASDGPAFATFTGSIDEPGGADRVGFDLDGEDFTMSSDATLSLTFLVSAPDGSGLEPGQVDIVGVDGTPDPDVGPRRQQISGAAASVALAEIGAGAYDVVVHGREHTSGEYELAVSLTGDVDGDFEVDEEDLAEIGTLRGLRWHHSGYVPAADTDRNGVINNGDLRRASRNLDAATSLRPDGGDGGHDVENPLDTFLDDGALRLVGLSADGFNPVGAPVRFELDGAEFWQDLDEVALTVNGSPVASGAITLEPTAITAEGALVHGRNEIALAAYDDEGRNLYHEAEVWAGLYDLQVDLVDEDGAPLTEPSTVVVELADEQDIAVAATTSTGTAVFTDVPFSTIVVSAASDGGHYGASGLLGGQQTHVQVPMVEVGEPSDVDNNDFSLGTDGWDIGDAPAWIVPHTEDYPPGLYPPPQSTGTLETSGTRDGDPPHTPAEPQEGDDGDDEASISQSENDLVLSTQGQGEQGVSRTFATEPGTSSVSVTYRFITSEVPGGWFGSEFNDYFRVVLASGTTGDTVAEANSMNGLGLAAFDFASGATAWREETLEVDPEGDVVRVDAAVANVGDGLFDSQVVLAWVEENRDQVRPALTWNNTQGGMDLAYEVVDGDLEADTPIDVHWATGPGYGDRVGTPVFTHTVPAGTPEGEHGPVRVDGGLLEQAPAGITHLVASASETSVAPLEDVRVEFGAHADPAVVRDATIDIIKGGLRAAGQASATITSTARRSEDQARAMFNNLVRADRTIEENVQNQLAIYGANGDQVIQRFVAETEGMTRQEIEAAAAQIRQAMVDEIDGIGCQNVSRHCADPDERNVVDVSAAGFTAANSQLFMDSVSPRVDHFIDERTQNNCFHLEVV